MSGTAMKLGTQGGRLPTGSKNVNQDAVINSVGFNAKVNVDKRLVTQQGLEGIKKQKDTSGGRKIIDKYYYLSLLKKKTTDIQNEIINLKSEIENINKDINEYNNLNKTFEILSREVQNLEGELADYNLAGDKYRSSMRAEDIESVYNHIRLNNKKKRDESDYLYLEKAKREEELHKVEYEINKVMQSMEQRLMDLDPEQKIEYEQLREENQNYIIKIHEVKEELSRINIEVLEGENLLKNNPNKKEAHKLKDAINQMQRKKEELELQTNESGLSVEELKERLVNKYKEDTQEKNNVDKKVIELKKVIDSYKKSISEIEKEMKNNTQNENVKAHDSISQKDKEYSNFIENFTEIKKNYQKEIETREEIIISLLENVSEKINNKTINNQNTQFKDIKQDIDVKKDLIKKSITTLEEAQAQYESLQVKMKRLDNLEETLRNEINNFKEKIDKARADINEKFDRIDYMKEHYKSEQKKMLGLLDFLQKNKENYNKLLTSLILKNRSKTNQLEEMDSYKKLREIEKKMQENENIIFSLTAFVDSKLNESDFNGIMKECIELQQEINTELVKKTLSVKI